MIEVAPDKLPCFGPLELGSTTQAPHHTAHHTVHSTTQQVVSGKVISRSNQEQEQVVNSE